ncbi:tetratricopeptide repeat protein [Kitasatospora aureofaciens]|uniref:AfsR/SARP family transcriptional regulator n=1 Tax=Kitasatospora aureofaciens TaxID=1894 RepID=UPI001C43EA3C|nr:AfsR/SARP family transcriptional regulator [Kitasatospora aureofaciens]MBV6698085.1 tetratricopeptide repeat protein [Kitasatospora aureofaciens]
MLQVVFRILGPLDVQVDGRPVPLSGARQRTILSMLLLSANRVVSVDTLADAVWQGRPPNTFVNQIAICVSGLRKTFKAAVGLDDLIVTVHPGYLLATGEHRIDAAEFEDLIAEAREATRHRRTAEAAELLDEALGLWRGPALEGVVGERVAAEAERLGELRLAVYEEYTALRLDLGRHRELVGELSSFIKENGLREQARAQLMLAQYRSGRRAEALETFREARRLFVDDLGIEPGPLLQKLHDAVLADESWLTAPAAVPIEEPAPGPAAAAVAVAAIPAQLPADVAAFTGRSEELAALDRLLAERSDSSVLPVGSITGIGGVGKTALARHWAHRVAARFPDGQLFADLRGYDDSDEPLTPNAVLDRFLRALGVPAAEIPAEPVERADRFRSELGGRRVLVVLDNARSYDQIRWLLPGSGRHCVLVTSRDPIEGLAGDYDFRHLSLGALDHSEAAELVTKVVGGERLSADPESVSELGALCDGLPLALRIAAARLAGKPHWTVRQLVDRLKDQHRRLDELSEGSRGVRAGFRLSYRGLPADVARMYRLLGLLNMPDFSAWAGAALLDIDPLDAEDLIEQLVDAQLLEVLADRRSGQVRYRFQDLLRLFAAECAHEEETPTARAEALRRVCGGLLFLAEEAHRRIYGGDFTVVHGPGPRHRLPDGLVGALVADPMEWFERERSSIVGSVDQAAESGESALAWDLTMTSVTLFQNRNYPEDWRQCAERALAAARRTGDALGEAAMLHSLSTLEIVQFRWAEAGARLDRARQLFTEQGERRGAALVQRNLALYERNRGNLATAREEGYSSLDGFRAVGDHYAEAHVLGILARIELECGEPRTSLELTEQAIAVNLRVGSTRGEAQSTVRLAEVLVSQGEGERAEAASRRALELVRAEGDLRGEAHSLRCLGEALWKQDRPAEAAGTLREALAAAERVSDRFLEARVRTLLACVTGLSGDRVAAAGLLAAAARQFEELGSPVWLERVAGLDRAVRGAGALDSERLWQVLEVAP